MRYINTISSVGSIRLQLLKIGAFVRISVRRIKFAMSSGCPVAAISGRAATRLNARLARAFSTTTAPPSNELAAFTGH
jgi:hypothetical protein